MDCKICFERFNKEDRQPRLCLPCTHTICLDCISKLNIQPIYNLYLLKKCPTCREAIESHKPNYSVLELLDSHLVVDKNAELKEKILARLKVVETLGKKLRNDWLNKSQTIKTTIESVKEEIYQKTQTLMDQLMRHQEKLISEADCFHVNIISKLPEISDLTFSSIQPAKDLDPMSQTELEAYSNQLLKTTADLNQKERDLAAVEPKIELKPSSLLYESLIGSLSTLIDSNKNTDRDFELQRLCIRQVSANPCRIRNQTISRSNTFSPQTTQNSQTPVVRHGREALRGRIGNPEFEMPSDEMSFDEMTSLQIPSRFSMTPETPLNPFRRTSELLNAVSPSDLTHFIRTFKTSD